MAIDFETATASRDSACAVGIAAVDGGRVVSSTSYLIQPPGNRYDSFNIRVHGITPATTADTPSFPQVMSTVFERAHELPLVAHNASFDMSVLRAGFDSCGHPCPQRDYYCTLLMSRSALLPDHNLLNVLAGRAGARPARQEGAKNMRIALASDHAGFAYKTSIASHLAAAGHEIVDFGTFSAEPVDYPDFIHQAAGAVSTGACERAVVLGGSGNGEAMAANRHQGVRCALCWSEETARLARLHNDANAISIGERLISEDLALRIVDIWMNTPFEGGRHVRRIKAIDEW